MLGDVLTWSCLDQSRAKDTRPYFVVLSFLLAIFSCQCLFIY